MKELFIILSSKYGIPVPSRFKEKLMEHFRGSKNKVYQIQYESMKALHE